MLRSARRSPQSHHHLFWHVARNHARNVWWQHKWARLSDDQQVDMLLRLLF